jgi:hypothetical protein
MRKYRSYVKILEDDVKSLEKHVEELKKHDITWKEIYGIIDRIYLNISNIKSDVESIEKLFRAEEVDPYIAELIYNLFDVFVEAWENGESSSDCDVSNLEKELTDDMYVIMDKDPRFKDVKCDLWELANTFVHYVIEGETYTEEEYSDTALEDIFSMCDDYSGTIYDLADFVNWWVDCIELLTKVSEALHKLIKVSSNEG